ncbi:hypothetical protein Ait01nite_049740 [Actinoplanes italicus]|nr:hypothetical protein Ait01nite_049740 [Actinoplanes italicus]
MEDDGGAGHGFPEWGGVSQVGLDVFDAGTGRWWCAADGTHAVAGGCQGVDEVGADAAGGAEDYMGTGVHGDLSPVAVRR